YLLGRMVWSVRRGQRVAAPRSVWPVWLLAAGAIFLVGFRIGLNVENSNVIDVGYSGVVGAERISSGESPYGNFPVEDSRKACGPADEDGEIRDRVQTNGRCESANPQGDTYGPVAYEAYLPAYWLFGWSGKWDRPPARETCLPRRIPRGDSCRVLGLAARAEPASRSSPLLRPDDQVPDRSPFSVFDLGLEAVRRGLSGPASGPAGPAGSARGRRD